MHSQGIGQQNSFITVSSLFITLYYKYRFLIIASGLFYAEKLVISPHDLKSPICAGMPMGSGPVIFDNSNWLNKICDVKQAAETKYISLQSKADRVQNVMYKIRNQRRPFKFEEFKKTATANTNSA